MLPTVGPGVGVPAAPEAVWPGRGWALLLLVYVWEMGVGSVHWVLLPPGRNPEVSAPSCHPPSSNLGCAPISRHIARGPIRMWVPFEAQGSRSWVSCCSAGFGLRQAKGRGRAVGVCRVVIQAGYRGPSGLHASCTAQPQPVLRVVCSLLGLFSGQPSPGAGCVCARNGLCRRCCECE